MMVNEVMEIFFKVEEMKGEGVFIFEIFVVVLVRVGLFELILRVGYVREFINEDFGR